MANRGQAKISRRCYNLETVVFSAQQEVTVPAGIKIPADTQYLIQPVLVMPEERQTVQLGSGKIRFQGQIEGLICSVDSNEGVHPLKIPAVEFMTAFAAPNVQGGSVIADAVIEAIEVDKGEDNTANITAFVNVSVKVLKLEETELVTGIVGENISADSKPVKLQHVLDNVQEELKVYVQLDLPKGADIAATDIGIGNLNWQKEEGMLLAQGVAMVRMYYINKETDMPGVANGFDEFEIQLPMNGQEATEATFKCVPVKTVVTAKEDGGQEVEITLKVKAVGYQETQTEIITDIEGADNLEKDLKLTNWVGEDEFKVNIEGDVQFPAEPQGIDLVIPRLRVTETKALDQKILVRGMLTLNIFFRDEEDKQRVLVHDEEFNQWVDLPGCETGYWVKARVWTDGASCEEGQYMVPIIIRVEAYEDIEFVGTTDVHVVEPGILPVSASIVVYMVAKGDTLFDVAKKFNVSMEMLKEYNSLAAPEVHLGQKLLIPIYQMKYINKA